MGGGGGGSRVVRYKAREEERGCDVRGVSSLAEVAMLTPAEARGVSV